MKVLQIWQYTYFITQWWHFVYKCSIINHSRNSPFSSCLIWIDVSMRTLIHNTYLRWQKFICPNSLSSELRITHPFTVFTIHITAFSSWKTNKQQTKHLHYWFILCLSFVYLFIYFWGMTFLYSPFIACLHVIIVFYSL